MSLGSTEYGIEKQIFSCAPILSFPFKGSLEGEQGNMDVKCAFLSLLLLLASVSWIFFIFLP